MQPTSVHVTRNVPCLDKSASNEGCNSGTDQSLASHQRAVPDVCRSISSSRFKMSTATKTELKFNLQRQPSGLDGDPLLGVISIFLQDSDRLSVRYEAYPILQ
jgi:hypothetical protein